jgi:penicillin-binding protein A
MRFEPHTGTKWRLYQRRLKRERNVSFLLARLPRLILLGCIVGAAAAGFYLAFEFLPWLFKTTERQAVEQPQESRVKPLILNPDILPGVLSGLDFGAPENPTTVPFEVDGYPYLLNTTIDADLQAYALRLLQRSKTVQSAIVVVQPRDGHVLTMASYDSAGGTENLCLHADFPAASIFKVVAAAAALENAGLAPESPMRYEGGRYTLYRRQLKEEVGRNAHETDFRKAFALSINPVFGRVGIYDLGREGLISYADKFLFTSSIPFEIPVMPSFIEVPEHEFGLAEVASGFNKTTLISPLHAAMISCAVVNGGVIMTPSLVASVVDGQGEVVHRGVAVPLTSAVEPETSEALRTLMHETVLTGTGRNSMSKLLRSSVYKGIEIGAKTGSINDTSGEFRLDWLIAYAIPEDGRAPICVAVLGVHGAYLGARSGELGRLIIARYFS